MADRETIDEKAERLFYDENPTWPRRWGWTEVPRDRKEEYRTRAREEACPRCGDIITGDNPICVCPPIEVESRL